MKLNGLTNEEVIINRKKYGSNIISKKKDDNFFKLLLETFSDPIIKILLIALGIKIIFLIRDFDWYETIGIIIAILVASIISTVSEYGSMKAFNKLTEETRKIQVKVRRNNQVVVVPLDEIVVDDIVVVSEGDKIPADGIVVEGNISVDESMLTGETKEVFKEYSKDNSMVYMGSVVYSGNALILIRSVGDNTFYGKMAKELNDGASDSPLRLRLTSLAKDISKIGYIASFLVAISYLIYMIFISNNFNMDKVILVFGNGKLMFSYILNALTLCVTIIVVAVPDG